MKLSLQPVWTYVDARHVDSTGSALNGLSGTLWRNHLNGAATGRKTKRASSTNYFGTERKAAGR